MEEKQWQESLENFYYNEIQYCDDPRIVASNLIYKI